MTQERFQRIDALFRAAVHEVPARRAALLHEACAGDSELRTEVESLLAFDAEPDTLVRRPALDPGQWRQDQVSSSELTLGPGAGALPHIPGYEVVRQLGAGGMGVVYEAEQRDPQRRVALKIIRPGQGTEGDYLKRFEREIHTLALLKHPGIATIHDAGCTPEGRRFFAMELVEGPPLTTFVEGQYDGGHGPLKLRDRLHVFTRICDAVAYAHQRGVIHRDLKPANILVAGELQSGEGAATRDKSAICNLQSAIPKVLDFGLARLTDPEASVTLTTDTGHIRGTLAYMSPEQAGGRLDEIDVRADVYALGVILFELVTGYLPLEFQGRSIPDMLRMIGEQPPRRPRSLNASVSGELELIVLKALEKDPDRRYGTVAALADDVERYLSGQPILARPPSTSYLLSKLIARHRIGAGFAAALFVLIVGFGAWMSVLYGRADSERRKAVEAERVSETRRADALAARDAERAARDEAEAVVEFLQSMLHSANTSNSQNPNARVRDVLDEAGRTIGASLAGRPLVEAAIRDTLGTTYLSLGLRDAAGLQLQAALDLRRSRLGDEHPAIADSLASVGEWLQKNSQYAAAQAHFQQALELRRKLQGPEHADVASLLAMQALNDVGAGDLRAAEHAYLQAIAILRRSGAYPQRLARCLAGLAVVLRDTHRLDEAEQYLGEALELYRAAFGDDGARTLGCMHNLAVIQADRGDRAGAEAVVREVLEKSRALLGNDHPNTVLYLTTLGTLLASRGDYAGAEALLTDGLQIARRMWGRATHEEAPFLRELAKIRRAVGDDVAAAQFSRELLAAEVARVGDQHPDVAYAHRELGRTLQALGQTEEAEVEYRQALSIYRSAHGDAHPRVAESLSDLASLQTDPQAAESMLREAIDTLRRCGPAARHLIAGPLGMLGKILLDQQRYEEAEPLIRECLGIREKFLKDRWVYASALTRLGTVLARVKRFEEAEALLRAGFNEMAGHRDAPARARREAVEELVSLYEAWGKPVEADQYRAELALTLGTSLPEKP